ncbi:hypothetical protein Hdeb2414_s0041g00738381 [Helianthus debilis subsp. tardiflorus]
MDIELSFCSYFSYILALTPSLFTSISLYIIPIIIIKPCHILSTVAPNHRYPVQVT